MKQFLFYPFNKIAGTNALLIGAGVMTITAIISSFSFIHFDGILDIHKGYELSLQYYFIEPVINWLVLSFLFMIIAKLSRKPFRAIDVLGTMAFARWPLIFAAIYGFVIPNPAHIDLNNSAEIGFIAIISLPLFLFDLYYLILTYKGFAVSTNSKGRQAMIAFIIALLIGEIITRVVFNYIYINL